MNFIKKNYSNIIFVIIIGLMIYPPTKVYFIRLISFSPSEIKVENQQQINNTNWHLKGLNSKNINLKELENNIVFISFWATWCAPCIAEMPSMQKLYEDYKEKVVFLFITDENWKTVSKFYIKKGFDFPTYNQLTQAPSGLESSTLPSTYILDKNKKIVVAKRGAAKWNSKSTRNILDALLK